MKKYLLILISVILYFGCNNPSQNKEKENRKLIAVATYVDNVVLDIIRDSFKDELINLGYTKENGWEIIIKSANGQPSEAVMVAEELLNMQPKVIVSISTPASKPVYDKNQGKIPFVFSFVSFPETIGITKDSKNTTGLSDGVDFNGTFTFIRDLVPDFKSLGMVYSDEPNAMHAMNEIRKLCEENQITFVGQLVSKEDEVKSACQTIASRNVSAIIVGADGVVVTQINAMVEVATNHKIPLFSMDEGTVESGAVAALSVNYIKFGKETADLTHKVIEKGDANSFEQKVYLGSDIVLNLSTAKEIGLSIPDSIINSAYKVFN